MNQLEAVAVRVKMLTNFAKANNVPIITARQKWPPSIPRLPSDSFDWSRWRAFTLFYDLNIVHRTPSLIKNKERIKEKAIGYCRSGELVCRPKFGLYAVMFEHEGEWQWTHLTNLEFHAIFCA